MFVARSANSVARFSSPDEPLGKLPETRMNEFKPSNSRRASSNSCMSAGEFVASSSTSFLRAAEVGAFEISGILSANQSCSLNFTLSHGGLPMMQSKPPWSKTWGKARCQWKKRYWRASSSTSVWRSAGRGWPWTKSRRWAVVMPEAVPCSWFFVLGCFAFFVGAGAGVDWPKSSSWVWRRWPSMGCAI